MSQSAAVEEQLTQFAVDTLKNRRAEGFHDIQTGVPELDAALAEPMNGMRLTSTAEDRTIVYDTTTNEPREILVNMLAATLKKRRADGKMAFTTAPMGEYKLGETLCWLHPEHPRRGEWDALGLRGIVCHSAHLASTFDARLHMEHRHARAWGVIKEELDRLTKEEDRALMRQLIAERQQASPSAPLPTIFPCTVEGCTRFFDNPQARGTHEARDHREA